MEEQETKEPEGQAEPELLYHYTTQDGLHGILKDKCIWATHYRFLNDSMERQIGLDIYKDTIFRIALEDLRSIESAKTLAEYIRRSYTNASDTNSLDAYIVSFCTSYTKSEYEKERQVEDRRGGDRLSQWRGYAKGAQGYCLAFDFQLAKQIQQLQQNRNSCYHSFCTYEDSKGRGVGEETRQKLETHVKELLESQNDRLTVNDLQTLESLHNALNGNEAGRKRMICFIFDMLLLCGTFKHVGFQEENEYRLIKLMFQSRPNSEKVRFRSGYVPYIEIPLNLAAENSHLRAIFVGPSANRDQAADGLQLRLKQMGLSHVEVVPSQIPYRNW